MVNPTPTRTFIRPDEINQILAVTDAMGFHREAVRVPLGVVAGGHVTIDSNRLVITAPSGGPLSEFVARLPALCAALNLSGLKRT